VDVDDEERSGHTFLPDAGDGSSGAAKRQVA
jgi:hypothetical protein